MSPESGLTTADLSAVLAAQRRFGGTTAIQPLVGAGHQEEASEKPGDFDFAKKNGQHPPDPDDPAEPVTTETSPSEDGLPPPQPISPEDQPPAAA